MNSDHVKGAIIRGIQKEKAVSLKFNIRYFSLFYGFVIDDIQIKIKKSPFLKIKKLVLDFNLPGFFIRDIGIYEIGLYEPKIRLKQNKKGWNFERLIPASKKQEEEKLPPPEEESEPVEELPVSLRVFFGMIIKNLKVDISSSGTRNSLPYKFGFENFNFKFKFISKKTDRLKDLFDDFLSGILFELNKQDNFNFYLDSGIVKTKSPLHLKWLLSYYAETKNRVIYSKSKIGRKKIPFQLKRRKLPSLGMVIEHSLNFDPRQDTLNLNFFRLSVLGKKWLDWWGKVNNITSSNPNYLFEARKSGINFTALKSYINPLKKIFAPDLKMSLRGSFLFKYFRLEGNAKSIELEGAQSIQRFRLRLPGIRVAIPKMNISLGSKINLKQAEILDRIHYASFKIKGKVNEGKINFNLFLKPYKKVIMDTNIKNLQLAAFAPMLRGPLNMNWKVRGSSIKSIQSDLNLGLPNLFYFIESARSGLNRIKLNVNTKLTSKDFQMKDMKINTKLSLSLQDQVFRDSIRLNVGTKIFQNPKSTRVSVLLNDFRISLNSLYYTVTSSLRESLRGIRKQIKGPIILQGDTSLKSVSSTNEIKNTTRIKIPSLNISDLFLKVSIKDTPKATSFKQFSLTGLKKALRVALKGSLRKTLSKAKPIIPNLKFELDLIGKQKRTIFADNSIQGSLEVRAKAVKEAVSGHLKIKGFNYEVKNSLNLRNFNLYFPFEHLLEDIPKASIARTSIDSLRRQGQKFNLTVDSLQISDPQKKESLFELAYSTKNHKAIEGILQYKRNHFKIPLLEIQSLNGLILLKNLQFYVGSGDPAQMQYLLDFVVKDIDFKKLLPQEKADSIEDASLRLDGSFKGSDLDHAVENVTGFLSVHKIGSQFGKSILNIVSPGFFVGVINNFATVNKINLEIKEGITYTKIAYSNGIVGKVVLNPQSYAGEQIEQYRLPLAEFLRRSNSEISTYYVQEEN